MRRVVAEGAIEAPDLAVADARGCHNPRIGLGEDGAGRRDVLRVDGRALGKRAGGPLGHPKLGQEQPLQRTAVRGICGCTVSSWNADCGTLSSPELRSCVRALAAAVLPRLIWSKTLASR